MQPVRNDKIAEHLNALLRGERSAVETYRIARDKFRVLGWQGEINQNLSSHEERVALLTSRILALGGAPARSSGAWGALAKVVEGGAAVFGDHAAIAVLEEGEDKGMRNYKAALRDIDLDEATVAFTSELFEKQQRTHRTMSDLKHAMSGKARPQAPAV